MTPDQTVPGRTAAADNVALPPDVTTEAWREAIDRSDAGAKQVPGAAEAYVQIETFLVRGLRSFQAEVDRFIKGYLAFEEVQRVCLKGRRFCEEDDRRQTGYRSLLRHEAWEGPRDAYRRRPTGLDHLLGDVEAELDGIRQAVTAQDSPVYDPAADLDAFALQLSHRLSNVLEAVAVILGTCEVGALEALERLNGHVESIFNRTEEAREAAAASVRAAFEGSAQDRRRRPISEMPIFGAQNATKPAEITSDALRPSATR